MKTKHITYLCAFFLWILSIQTQAQEATNLHPVDEFSYTKHRATVSFTENTTSKNNKVSTAKETAFSTKSSSREAGITPVFLMFL